MTAKHTEPVLIALTSEAAFDLNRLDKKTIRAENVYERNSVILENAKLCNINCPALFCAFSNLIRQNKTSVNDYIITMKISSQYSAKIFSFLKSVT